jgi:hypothetical protein
MKNKIRRNLILKVDYERVKSFSGILLNQHKFYIIGVLAVFIIFGSSKKEIAKLQVKEEIPIGDPELKRLIGIKATDLIRGKKYEQEIACMIVRLENTLNEIKKRKYFGKRPIEDILIISIK